MTFAPQTLKDLAALWIANGGVNLGIVGDTGHVATGTSYHLGESQLADGAYSAKLPRDVDGLSEAASAIDLGRLDGSLANLQAFSRWLVAWCRAGGASARDVREVIYSPDGFNVKRYDATTGQIYSGGTGTGQGDDSHRTHTHISYWRDSEFRDKRELFRQYFNEPPTDTEPPEEPAMPGVLLTSATNFDGRAQIAPNAPLWPLDGKPQTEHPGTPNGADYEDVFCTAYCAALQTVGIVVAALATPSGDAAELCFIPLGWYSLVPNPANTDAAFNEGRAAVLAAGTAVPER